MSQDIERATMLNEKKRSLKDAWTNEATEPNSNVMEQEGNDIRDKNGTSSSTGAKIKRKHLDTATDNLDSSETIQGKEITNQEEQSVSKGEPVSAKTMPEKHTLELILDVLQRRDTYEIFAEPVDPKEDVAFFKVGDYYKIIKEPMDFGTMRAKLHEGMYKTLEQFEHDIFLISGNAMQFNSSGTTYFRQARAIEELAQNVFHVLKTDPGKFELEFSSTRRRSGRRSQVKVKDYSFNSNAGTDTNSRVAVVTGDISSKEKQSHPSTSRKKLRGIARAGAHCHQYASLPRTQADTRCNLIKPERRSTCTPKMLFPNKKESILAHCWGDPRPLLLVDQSDISYGKSLMLFVKDLGPTAQMIARQKLEGLYTRSDGPTQDKVGQILDYTLNGYETEIRTNTLSDQKVVDLIHHGNHTIINPRNDLREDMRPDVDHDGGEPNYNDVNGVPHDTICSPNLNQRPYNKDVLHRSDKEIKERRTRNHGSNKRGTWDRDSESYSSTIFGKKISNDSYNSMIHMESVDSDMLNDSVHAVEKLTSKSKTTESIRAPHLQYVQSTHSGSDSKEKMNTTMGLLSFSSWLSPKHQRTISRADTKHDPSNSRGGLATISSSGGGSSNNQAMPCLQYPQWVSSSSSSGSSSSTSTRFTFDIPFLKSQLNQMKVMGLEKERMDGLFQQRQGLAVEAAAHDEHGNFFNTKSGGGGGGYIKVPVHFADQPSSVSAAEAAAQSSFQIHKQQQQLHSASSTSLIDNKLTLQL